MQKKGANISLKGYDDIFSTDQSRAEAQQERVQEIPLSELHPFEGHPFRVVDDEEMMKTAESVREFGVLTPAIVRPDPDGGYEIISGHRRHRASEIAGKETMPVIVRDLDDDAAIILMVDANLQRETILPSERAFAYSMKLDAIKHQGARSDLTSRQVVGKLDAADMVGADSGESGRQVQRYIRLTELIPELLDIEDDIISVLMSISNVNIASEAQKLSYEAMTVERKMNGNASAMVKNAVIRDVRDFYLPIQAALQQLEKDHPGKSDMIAKEMALFYFELKMKGLSQDYMYSIINDWLDAKTQRRYKLLTPYITAFYVQNCEVFS